MKNIKIIVGSNAVNSLNKKLGQNIIDKFSNLANFSLVSINELPFYSYEKEENVPASVNEFLNSIKEADGVMLLTPEYNNSIPGVLKNALDWASRGERVFQNKPVYILGVTPGILGTSRAQDHTRLILTHYAYNASILPGAQTLIGESFKKFDENGKLVDEKTIEFLESRIKDFITWIEKN